MKLVFHPLTPARWKDFEALFGENGACEGCWCQFPRRPHAEYQRSRGAGKKSAMRRLVSAGREPGLLAYDKGRAIGWCALAPREEYGRLERSRVLKPLDDKPVWSATCFFVLKPYRGKGVTVALLKEAVRYVKKRGGRILEGYPVEPKSRQADTFLWWGTASAFRKAGFKEAARRSPTRPIMRRQLSRRLES